MKAFLKKCLIQHCDRFVDALTLPVFLTHGVIEDPGPLFKNRFDCLSIDQFVNHIKYLKEHFKIISLSEALEKAKRNEPLKGFCSLTFDDGYSCLEKNAFPILEDFNVPATVSIISEVVDDNAVYWRDYVRYMALNGLEDRFLAFFQRHHANFECPEGSFYNWSKDPRFVSGYELQNAIKQFFEAENISLPSADQTNCPNLYLTREQIINAPSLIAFANHSASHPLFPSLGFEEKRQEIIRCRAFLEETGRGVDIFCLPFGKYDGDTLKAVRYCGYESIIFHSKNGKNTLSSLKAGIVNRYTLPACTDDLAWLLLRELF